MSVVVAAALSIASSHGGGTTGPRYRRVGASRHRSGRPSVAGRLFRACTYGLLHVSARRPARAGFRCRDSGGVQLARHRSQPAAILLDALGTLVALEPPAPRLRAELAQRFGLEVSEARGGRGDRRRDRVLPRPPRRGPRRRRPARAPPPLRRGAALGAARRAVALELDPLVEALLASLHFTAFADVRPGARVRSLARAAAGRGQQLGRVAGRRPAGLELEPLLDGIVTSAGAGARKPSPAIFEQALALAGVRPDEAIHVGDTLDEDVAGARAAGIEPVLIRRRWRTGGRAGCGRSRVCPSWTALALAAWALSRSDSPRALCPASLRRS